MTSAERTSVERNWARLGVLFAVAPAADDVDLESALLDAARSAGVHTRLVDLVVSWLREYGDLVAKHRLRRRVIQELESEFQPVLGFLIEAAVELGASRELLIVSGVCGVATEGRPLAAVLRGDADLERHALRTASEVSKRWGVWAPSVELKRDAIAPVGRVLAQNAGFKARAMRRGDLRCSILETLVREFGGQIGSEMQLARWAGATRAAVRKALTALVLEGDVVVERGENRRAGSVVRVV